MDTWRVYEYVSSIESVHPLSLIKTLELSQTTVDGTNFMDLGSHWRHIFQGYFEGIVNLAADLTVATNVRMACIDVFAQTLPILRPSPMKERAINVAYMLLHEQDMKSNASTRVSSHILKALMALVLDAQLSTYFLVVGMINFILQYVGDDRMAELCVFLAYSSAETRRLVEHFIRRYFVTIPTQKVSTLVFGKTFSRKNS